MLPGSQGPDCSMLAVLPATPRSIVSAVPEQVCPHVTVFSAVLLKQEQSGDANFVRFKT